MPVTRLGPRCHHCQRRPIWDEPTLLCSPCWRLAGMMGRWHRELWAWLAGDA